MSYIYGASENTFFIFMVIVIVVVFLLFSFYLNVFVPFMKERRYIKMEMQRSDDEEYKFWKNKLKKLFLKHMRNMFNKKR